MPPEIPNISLCIITRDQDQLLKRCLEHHRPLYDEAVVVDTAPDESSLQAFTAPGVSIIHFPWRDDFSQARNFGLNKATGKNILVLDCDELIAPEDFSILRARVAQNSNSCLVFPQRNYLPQSRGSGWEPTGAEHLPYSLGAPGFHTAWSIRVFPGDRGLQYSGAVHETLDKAVQGKGLPSTQVAISIHHQGHMLDYPRPQGRTSFYGNLLVKKVQQEPRNPMARYELAVHLVAVGKSPLAEKWLEKALAEFPFWSGAYRMRLLLGEIRLQQGQNLAAAGLYGQALAERPDWPGCWQGTISARIALEDREGAVQHINQARTLFPLNPAWDQYEAQVLALPGR